MGRFFLNWRSKLIIFGDVDRFTPLLVKTKGGTDENMEDISRLWSDSD